jgi:hypothetical protein
MLSTPGSPSTCPRMNDLDMELDASLMDLQASISGNPKESKDRICSLINSFLENPFVLDPFISSWTLVLGNKLLEGGRSSTLFARSEDIKVSFVLCPATWETLAACWVH